MDYEALMELAARAGEIMLMSGAEVYRVEDTISRILRKSGLQKVDVFVLTTGIVATLSDPSIRAITVVRRVSSHVTNLNRISRVNDISRRFCSGQMALEDARAELEKTSGEAEYGFWKKCVGYTMTTGFFAVLFGGEVWECLSAAVIGCILALVLGGSARIHLNDFCQNAVGAFAIAVAALGIRQMLLPQLNLDAVIISAIMPLVPGVTFTSAIRDTLNGDYSSGVARMAESVIVALAVASGVGVAMLAHQMMGGAV